jgi:hypothetical protein
MFHDLEAPGSIHVPYNWTYADATEREADTSVVTAHLGRFARQLNDNSIWMLTAVTPTWVPVGTPQAVTTVNTQTGDVVLDADDVGAFSATTKTDVLQAGAFAADAGSNDTYVATLSPAITGYVTGAHYRFKANTANTGAATINLNGLGAKTIKKAAGGITTDLADNDIRAGQWVDLVYDGTNMQMQSLLGNAPGGGGGGSPGGSDTQLQRNASSSFGGISGATSDGTNVTFGSGNLRATDPRITTGIRDTNGEELLKFTAASSPVNEVILANAATGDAPSITATGSDTDVTLKLGGKGDGGVQADVKLAVVGELHVQTTGITNKFQMFTFASGSGDIPANSAWLRASAGPFVIFPDATGTAGSKLVMVAWNGSAWKSMLEYAHASGASTVFLAKNAGRVVVGATDDGTNEFQVNGVANLETLKVRGGTGITKILSGSGTIDFPNMSAGAEATRDVTVTGASTSGTPSVSLGWSAALETGLMIKQVWVSAADTVSITVVNTTAGLLDPASLTCRATVTAF